MPDPGLNVYSYTHQWLWSVLENDPEFSRLVPRSSRAKLMSFYVPELIPMLAEADSPHVFVTLSDTNIGQEVASNTSIVRITYDIRIYTSGLDLGPTFDVMWAVFGALIRARVGTAPNDPYIFDARIMNGKHDVLQSGRVSVVSVCSVDISVSVPSSSLQIKD